MGRRRHQHSAVLYLVASVTILVWRASAEHLEPTALLSILAAFWLLRLGRGSVLCLPMSVSTKPSTHQSIIVLLQDS
jgi:hypothetical protein